MMLMCCSDCQYRGARPRRTLYGPGVWCSHPDNRDSVPRGVLHAGSASVECAYTQPGEARKPDERGQGGREQSGREQAGRGRERGERTPVVRVRRRIPVSGTA